MTTHLDAILARLATYIRSLHGHSLKTAAEKAWAYALQQEWISLAVFKSHCLVATKRDGDIHLELGTKFQTVVFGEAIQISGSATDGPWDSNGDFVVYESTNTEHGDGMWRAEMACEYDSEFVDHARNYYAAFATMLQRIYERNPPQWIVDIMREELGKTTW